MQMNRLKVKVSEECLECIKEMYGSYKHPHIYEWLILILDRVNQNREVSLEKRKKVENIMKSEVLGDIAICELTKYRYFFTISSNKLSELISLGQKGSCRIYVDAKGYIKINDVSIHRWSLGYANMDTVHHIDGYKFNNIEDNLLNVDGSAHSALHRLKDENAIRYKVITQHLVSNRYMDSSKPILYPFLIKMIGDGFK